MTREEAPVETLTNEAFYRPIRPDIMRLAVRAFYAALPSRRFTVLAQDSARQTSCPKWRRSQARIMPEPMRKSVSARLRRM